MSDPEKTDKANPLPADDAGYDRLFAESLDLMARKHEDGKGGERAVRRVRHKKRGTTYQVLGTAELQMASDLVDGSFLTIYRGEDGKLWARQEDEFEDGRFEEVPP